MPKEPKYLKGWEPSAAQRKCVAAAALAYGVEVVDVLKKTRSDPLWRARQAATWALKTRWPALSYPQIIRVLGRLDHSTAIHNFRRATELRAADKHFRAVTDALAAEREPPIVPVSAEVVARAEQEAREEKISRLTGAARNSLLGETDEPYEWSRADFVAERAGISAAGQIAIGSDRLLERIRRYHPERCAA